jgi:hypothetical protein
LIHSRLNTSAQAPFTLKKPKKKRILGLHNTCKGALNTPRLDNFSLAAATFWFTPDSRNSACTVANNVGAEATDLRDNFRYTFQTSGCLMHVSIFSKINQQIFYVLACSCQ